MKVGGFQFTLSINPIFRRVQFDQPTITEIRVTAKKLRYLVVALKEMSEPVSGDL